MRWGCEEVKMNLNYPKYPLLIEKVEYKNYENAGLYLTRFVEDNIPVLFIGNEETGEMYAICNINPESYKLKTFEFAIKNYSENEGMLDWLISNGYIEKPHSSFPSGYVNIPVCYAADKLKKFIIEKCK